MKLVITDLDQTLVDLLPIHDAATNLLFRRCFGVDAHLIDIDFSGKNLNDNFSELARLKGVPPARLESCNLLPEYERIFGELVPRDASKYVLPGAELLLKALTESGNLVALYTGDSAGVVRHTLKATGLGKYLRFCLYGTEVNDRAEMVKQAIEKAYQLTGKRFEDKNIVIIGDSIRDIEAARPFNALTIAIATGFHSPSELAGHEPDYLFPNLKKYQKVLEAITRKQEREAEV